MSTRTGTKVTIAEVLAAAARNDLETLARYVAQGGDIDVKGDDQRSALVIAIHSGSREFALHLIRSSPDLGDQWSTSALKAAVDSSDPQIVDAVYSEMAAQTRFIPVALIGGAIDKGDGATIRRFVRQGQSVETNVAGRTLLGRAAEAKQYPIMRLLLEMGAKPNPLDVDEKLLCRVAGMGDVQAAEILFEYGDNNELLEASDARGNKFKMAASSPVDGAARQHKHEMLAYLIARGARVDKLDDNGWHPIVSVLSRFSGSPMRPDSGRKSLELLLDNMPKELIHGRFPSATISTLLHLAADQDLGWAVEPLLKHGLPIDQVQDSGIGESTAFLRAAYKGSISAIDALARQGADVNAVIKNGKGALHLLALGCEDEELNNNNHGPEDVLVRLLGVGCGLDARDKAGVSARKRLMAANSGFKTVIAAHDARNAMKAVSAASIRSRPA